MGELIKLLNFYDFGSSRIWSGSGSCLSGVVFSSRGLVISLGHSVFFNYFTVRI